jgi:Fe-S cluster assembly protein SufD
MTGVNGTLKESLIITGGNGRSRITFTSTAMEESNAIFLKGLSLSGGEQNVEIKTNLHHIAAGCTSSQSQRNVVAGRSKTNFKGRIRVEQSSQQLASTQLIRSLLLSDSGTVNVVPSLEIIADDVTCTHGATVSDLSQEELFYLRSRGLDKDISRTLQIQAFVDDMTEDVVGEFLGDGRRGKGLKERIFEKLRGLAPDRDRAIDGEYQSS